MVCTTPTPTSNRRVPSIHVMQNEAAADAPTFTFFLNAGLFECALWPVLESACKPVLRLVCKDLRQAVDASVSRLITLYETKVDGRSRPSRAAIKAALRRWPNLMVGAGACMRFSFILHCLHATPPPPPPTNQPTCQLCLQGVLPVIACLFYCWVFRNEWCRKTRPHSLAATVASVAQICTFV